MADISITIPMEVREEFPDGSKCLGCEDPIFLSQYRLHMFLDGQWRPTNLTFCQSCARPATDY